MKLGRRRSIHRLAAISGAWLIATSLLAVGPVTPVRADDPTSYDLIDITESLGTVYDPNRRVVMNAAGQVAGVMGGDAFYYDGDSTSVIPGSQTSVNDIDGSGRVVGQAQHDGQSEAFLYDGTMHFLGTLGGSFSTAVDINEVGGIVGSSETAGGGRHAFLYSDGVMTDLAPLGAQYSDAVAVDDDGVVTGSYIPSGGFPRVFFFDGTTAFDIGAQQSPQTRPNAMNEAGQVTGIANGFISREVFRYSGGRYRSWRPFLSLSSNGIAINDAGVIAGNASPFTGLTFGFTNDGLTDTMIPPITGWHASVKDINERGHVVGYDSSATTQGLSRGYLFVDGQRTDLTSRLPSGSEYVITRGLQILDDGRILAVGHIASRDAIVILVPTAPLPPIEAHATGVDPVLVTVIDPNGGTASITASTTLDAPPPGTLYTYLSRQIGIVSPSGTAADPLTVTFDIDASVLQSVEPILSADTLAIFRDGVPVPPCTVDGADAAATPDPCVASRETQSGILHAGDARITVLTSAASQWNVGIVPTVPTAPACAYATKGDRSATVEWCLPDDGRSPITGYTVTASPGGRTASVDGSAYSSIVTGLTNGTEYTFTVTATNALGTSAPSEPSNAVTPAAPQGQTITFPKPPNKTLLDSPVAIAASASSGLPITLTTTTPGICTPYGLDLYLQSAGSCTLTATQPGNSDYSPAKPVTRTFTISQVAQVITFVKPSNRTLLQTPVALDATVNSPLPVTLTSTTPSVCTVSASEAALLTVGTCTITATQPGDAVYKPANPVTKSFTVSLATQTITFDKPSPKTLLQTPITVDATSTSGLPVTLTSTSPSICAVTGFEITLLATGACAITASQPGDAVYKAATSVSRTFNVTKAPQTITLPDPGQQELTVPTVILTPFASSGLPVTLASTTVNVCSVNGDTLTLKKVGTCKVKATQPGDAIYAAAPAVTLSIPITATGASAFVVASGDELRLSGQPFSFHGASIYGTSNPGAPTATRATFEMALAGGLNSLRIVNMFDERGLDVNAPYNEADWVRVDGILARANGAGMKVVLDLSAFRNHLVNRDIRSHGWEANCQPGGDRSPVDYSAVDPYRASLASEWNAFIDFVTNRVNTVTNVRYKFDVAIGVISIAGEPQPPGSEECGKAVSATDLTDFYTRALGHLRSVDGSHLRSSGGLIHLDWQQLYGGSSGIDGEAIFALADNTLPALHTYPPQYAGDGTPIDYQTPVYGPVADGLGKPWFTEEFGWTQSVGDATRADYFDWLYQEQDAYGSDGAMFWNLGPESAGGSHDVNPGTPLAWAEVQAR